MSHDITDFDEACSILLSLSESVAARLRSDQVTAYCITVKYTDYRFIQQSHQRSLTSATNVTEEIYQTAVSLLREMWSNRIPLRLLGVCASRLDDCATCYQYNLFDGDKHDRLEKLDSAIDAIRGRFGSGAIQRGRFLPPQSDKKQ